MGQSYVALFDIVKHGYYRENASCLFLNHFHCKICHSSYIWSENELILFQISSHTFPKQTVEVKGWQFAPVYCCMGLYQCEYVMKRSTIVYTLKQESRGKYNPEVSVQLPLMSFQINVFWHCVDLATHQPELFRHNESQYCRL